MEMDVSADAVGRAVTVMASTEEPSPRAASSARRVAQLLRGMALSVGLGMFALHSSAPILARSWPQLSLSLVGVFDEPVHITGAGDGSGRLFIVEMTGKIRIVRNGTVQSTPFLDLTSLLDCGDGRKRLLSLAFPPGYSGLGHFYVKYLDKSCNIVVARFRTTGNPDIADINSRQIIISQPVGVGLFGGPLYFGPFDGYLYVSFGDGSITDDAPGNAAQDLTTLLGKVLRIDVETNNPATYSIPPTNPYAGTPGYRPEIWASGLRNPWRFSFDRQTGDLYIGDVGSTRYEEVNFRPADSPGGEDYGWKTMEAAHCFGSPTCTTTGLVLPVVEVRPHARRLFDHWWVCLSRFELSGLAGHLSLRGLVQRAHLGRETNGHSLGDSGAGSAADSGRHLRRRR